MKYCELEVDACFHRSAHRNFAPQQCLLILTINCMILLHLDFVDPSPNVGIFFGLRQKIQTTEKIWNCWKDVSYSASVVFVDALEILSLWRMNVCGG